MNRGLNLREYKCLVFVVCIHLIESNPPISRSHRSYTPVCAFLPLVCMQVPLDSMANPFDEMNLPVGSVTKILKSHIPDGLTVSADAKQRLTKAASVFVLYLASTAHDHSRDRKRMTIQGDDVLSALDDIGLPLVTETVEAYADSLRDAAARKKSTLKRSRGEMEGEKGSIQEGESMVEEVVVEEDGMGIKEKTGDSSLVTKVNDGEAEEKTMSKGSRKNVEWGEHTDMLMNSEGVGDDNVESPTKRRRVDLSLGDEAEEVEEEAEKSQSEVDSDNDSLRDDAND